MNRSGRDRRAGDRRNQADRRQQRIDAVQAALDPLRAAVREGAERIRTLEREQKVQLVRISQLQRELDELKKSG